MMIMAMMMVMTITASAGMNFTTAKNEALFLSDKMAYELNLTDAQYDAVYEINLDYLMSVNGHADVFGTWWNRRNADLRFVLTAWQYDRYVALNYFYRPISWHKGAWTFHVYSHYDRAKFFRHHPTVFVSYKGGHNHKPAHFYADRRVAKPAPAARPHVTPKRNPGVGAIDKGHHTGGHNNVHKGNRQIAQNTNKGNKSGRFGGRR